MSILTFSSFPPGADFYEQFQNLSRGDMAATHSGLAYAIGARIIGDAKAEEGPTVAVPDVELAIFDRGGKKILAIQADEGPRDAKLNVSVSGNNIFYTDTLAKTVAVKAGNFQVPLDRSGFLHGASRIEVKQAELPEMGEDSGFEVEVTDARLDGFSPRSNEERGPWVVAFQKIPSLPEAERPEVVFPIHLPKDGTYEFYLNVQWMANRYRSLSSPIEWSLNGKTYHPVNETSAHWRKSTREHLRFGLVENPENETILHQDMICKIGSLRRLKAGDHNLHIRLAAPRTHDGAFSAEIGNLIYREIADDME